MFTSHAGALMPHVDSDPFFDDVLLLLHGDGPIGQQALKDSSKYDRVFTPTSTPNGTQVTHSDPKFAAGCIVNDGTLQLAETPAIDLAGGPYTAEWWFRSTVDVTNMRLLSMGSLWYDVPGEQNGFAIRVSGSGGARTMQWVINGATNNMGGGTALFDGLWHWFVVCGDELGNAFFAVDGVKTVIRLAAVNPLTAIASPPVGDMSVGGAREGVGATINEPLIGAIDELRITRRIRYTMGGLVGDTIPVQSKIWPDV